MKSFLSILKKTLTAGLAGILLSSATPVLAKQGIHITPDQKYSAEIESDYKVKQGNGEYTQRVEVLEGQNYLLRVEYGQEHSALGARVPLSGSLVNGLVDIFSSDNSTSKTNGQGLNGDLTFDKRFILGGAAEKARTPLSENTALNGYAGLDLSKLLDQNIDSLRITAGAVQVQKGNETRLSYHQNALMDWSRFIAGFGFQWSTKDYSFGHLVLGQYPETKDHGFGWRAWVTGERSSNQNEDTYVKGDLMLTLDSRLTATSFLEPFSTKEGYHEGEGDLTTRRVDPFYATGFRVTPNINDYITPPVPLHHRARTAALELEYGYDENNPDWYRGNIVVYPIALAKKCGAKLSNLDLIDNFWVGGGYNSETKNPNAGLGTRMKILDQTSLELYGKADKDNQFAFLGIYQNFN